MERTAVNPVTWSQEMGFNQGEVISGETRTLYISGQTAMSKDGRPEHDGDAEAQLALAVANLEAVLAVPHQHDGRRVAHRHAHRARRCDGPRRLRRAKNRSSVRSRAMA